MEEGIKELKYFVINEMGKLKYYNYEAIERQDRVKSDKLEADGLWDGISELQFIGN